MENNACTNRKSICYVLGPTGPTGPQGLPASTIMVNSTTTGAPGTSAHVINSGDLNNVRLDFIIPEGKMGPSPTLEVGSVITGAPGSSASVIIKPLIK